MACPTDAGFDSRDIAESWGLFKGPESLDADVVSGGFAEYDTTPGEAVEKGVEPAVAGDHRAGDAEVGETDVLAGHGCYAADC